MSYENLKRGLKSWNVLKSKKKQIIKNYQPSVKIEKIDKGGYWPKVF